MVIKKTTSVAFAAIWLETGHPEMDLSASGTWGSWNTWDGGVLICHTPTASPVTIVLNRNAASRTQISDLS